MVTTAPHFFYATNDAKRKKEKNAYRRKIFCQINFFFCCLSVALQYTFASVGNVAGVNVNVYEARFYFIVRSASVALVFKAWGWKGWLWGHERVFCRRK